MTAPTIGRYESLGTYLEKTYLGKIKDAPADLDPKALGHIKAILDGILQSSSGKLHTKVGNRVIILSKRDLEILAETALNILKTQSPADRATLEAFSSSAQHVQDEAGKMLHK